MYCFDFILYNNIKFHYYFFVYLRFKINSSEYNHDIIIILPFCIRQVVVVATVVVVVNMTDKFNIKQNLVAW